MEDLIQLISSRLGIDPATARTVVSKIMALLKSNLDPELFRKIEGAVAGADQAAEQTPEPAAGDGLMGKLATSVSALLGGKSGAGAEVVAALASSGIDANKIRPLLNTVFEFLRGKLGDDVVDQIIAKLPMLKPLLNASDR